MPIYEYKCENGHVFDVMQKMAEDPLTECVECGAPAVRVLHSPAVHFKGSGFYNTDYGKRRRAAGPAATATAPRSRRAPTRVSSSSDSKSSELQVRVEGLLGSPPTSAPTLASTLVV